MAMNEYRFSVAFTVGEPTQDVVILPHEYGDLCSVTIELPAGIVEKGKISLPRSMFSNEVLRHLGNIEEVPVGSMVLNFFPIDPPKPKNFLVIVDNNPVASLELSQAATAFDSFKIMKEKYDAR